MPDAQDSTLQALCGDGLWATRGQHCFLLEADLADHPAPRRMLKVSMCLHVDSHSEGDLLRRRRRPQRSAVPPGTSWQFKRLTSIFSLRSPICSFHCLVQATTSRPERPTAERSTLWRHGAAQPHPSIARAAAGDAAAEWGRERRPTARGELAGDAWFSLGPCGTLRCC
jgi:hypothetical protein